MLSFPKFGQVLVAVSLMWCIAGAANTDISCESHACYGESFEITCKLSGSIDGTAWNRPDTIEVISCTANNSECLPANNNYNLTKKSPTEQVLRIEKFGEKDAGEWSCRDGFGEVKKMCDVTGLTAPKVTGLKAGCTLNEHEKFVVTCEGQGTLGDPPVKPMVKGQSGFINTNWTLPEYKAGVSDDASGNVLECLLEGPGAQCLAISRASVTCPSTGLSPGAIVGIVVAPVIVIIAIIVGVIIFVLKRKRSGSDITSEKQSGSQDKKTGEKSEIKDEKDGKKQETVPMLPADAPKVEVTAEDETKKMKDELEPEDKQT